MPRPTLILITGRPGAGKTTLARKLAPVIHCPLVSRDDIKEGIVNTTGSRGAPNDDTTLRTYETFFDTIELLLRRDVTLVAEAAFQHKRWAPKIEPLLSLADVKIIVCRISPELANDRINKRSALDPEWDRFHNAPLDQTQQSGPKAYDPPELDLPTLSIDTSDQYQPDFKTILDFAKPDLDRSKR